MSVLYAVDSYTALLASWPLWFCLIVPQSQRPFILSTTWQPWGAWAGDAPLGSAWAVGKLSDDMQQAGWQSGCSGPGHKRAMLLRMPVPHQYRK